MNIEKISAVIFDLDGTLYNNKWLPLRLVLADLPKVMTLVAERKARKAIKGIDYQNEEGVFNALFSKIAEYRNNYSVQKAAEWYKERYMPAQVAVLALYFSPRPCVDELLKSLREQGVKTILYSDYDFAEEKLEALNIDPALFDHIVSAPELGGLKPCRQSIERLIDRYGLDSATTLMVGDRDDTDGETARCAGLDFYNVKTQGWDELLVSLIK